MTERTTVTSMTCTTFLPAETELQRYWSFFWVHPPKNHPQNPHFYFNLILVYTVYATNNAIFYCFKAFKALSYWVFVLFYLFFPACPKKTQ